MDNLFGLMTARRGFLHASFLDPPNIRKKTNTIAIKGEIVGVFQIGFMRNAADSIMINWNDIAAGH